jgi:hypothetical protein
MGGRGRQGVSADQRVFLGARMEAIARYERVPQDRAVDTVYIERSWGGKLFCTSP